MSKDSFISCFFILLFGFVMFYFGTDGFTAYTAETARVNKLNKEQPKVPNVILEDSNGQTYSFDEFKGKYVFITFMYTGCTTVCPRLEMNMSKVYGALPNYFFEKDIYFLTISFDPTRDTVEVLDKYKNYFNSDGETWRMARIQKNSQLNALLKAFGVIVLPDGNGNFAHNSAFYLVDRDGSLLDVMDYKMPNKASRNIISIINNERSAKK